MNAKPITAVSGCPTRTVATNTSVSTAPTRRRRSGSRARSSRNSVQGHRQITADCGNISQGGVKENESAKTVEAKAALLADAPSSRTQSHIPAAASRSRIEDRSVKPRASGRRSPSSVSGENAAEMLFAASGIPHPFQRLNSGSAPSFQARRTSFAHGTIWVATSFRNGLNAGW